MQIQHSLATGDRRPAPVSGGGGVAGFLLLSMTANGDRAGNHWLGRQRCPRYDEEREEPLAATGARAPLAPAPRVHMIRRDKPEQAKPLKNIEACVGVSVSVSQCKSVRDLHVYA